MSPHIMEVKQRCTGVGFHGSITCDTWGAADTAGSQVEHFQAEHFLGHPNRAGLGTGTAKVSWQQTICSRQQTDTSTPHKEKECIV